MKLGLFGGTFDPIHWGHLRSAEEVREAFSLQRVIFVPTSNPPHKKQQPTTSPLDRLKMVERAIAGNPRFSLSTVEIDRPGKSYSIDTIRHFCKTKSAADLLYFIVGMDAFRFIESWKDVQEIFRLCHFIVTSRPGCGDSMSLEEIPVAVRGSFCYDRNEHAFRHESGTHLFFIKLTDIAISASEIRRRVREERSIRYLVPSEVEAYIKSRGLYKDRREGG